MTSRKSQVKGFTLIEVLAATTMVAVLAASLYASLRIAFKARDSAEQAMDNVRAESMIVELIKADIQSAVIPTGQMADEFTGTSGRTLGGALGDSLVFYTTACDVDPVAGIGDVTKVEYSCEQVPGSEAMVLNRYVTTNLLSTMPQEPKAQIISRKVRSFTLRYFDGSDWQESWDSTQLENTLPRAVELTIELQGTTQQEVRTISRVLAVACGNSTPASGSSFTSPAAPSSGGAR